MLRINQGCIDMYGTYNNYSGRKQFNEYESKIEYLQRFSPTSPPYRINICYTQKGCFVENQTLYVSKNPGETKIAAILDALLWITALDVSDDVRFNNVVTSPIRCGLKRISSKPYVNPQWVKTNCNTLVHLKTWNFPKYKVFPKLEYLDVDWFEGEQLKKQKI